MADGFEMDINLKFELILLSLKKTRDTLNNYIEALEEAKKIKKQLYNMKRRLDSNEETFEDIMGFATLATHAEENHQQILEIQNRLRDMEIAVRGIL